MPIDRAKVERPKPRRITTTGTGPPCKVDGHGSTYPLNGRWWCPHQEHDGAPRTSPRGPQPTTQSFFTDDELV